MSASGGDMRQTGHDSVLNRWQKTFDPPAKDPLPKSGNADRQG
jgi:hypothetical protein